MIALRKTEKKFLDMLTKSMKLDKPDYERPTSYRKFDNGGAFMALVVEVIGPNMISLAHYGKLNGDAMRDPEMTFYRNSQNNWFPAEYQADYSGTYHRIIEFDETGKAALFNKRLQTGAEEFARLWFRNILDQQGTDKACHHCGEFGLMKDIGRQQIFYTCPHCGAEIAGNAV